MGAKSKHLFLCHSHEDKKFVRTLSSHLNTLSVTVWFDEWELSPGDSLHDCIGEAIERSAYVGVILSPNAIKSRWCQAELDQALTREKRTGSKVVIPLLYRRVQIPPFVEGRLYVNFSKSYFSALAGLAAFALGIETREYAQRIANLKPRTVEEVKTLLRDDRPPDFVLNADDYRKIKDVLAKAGLNISSDQFGILANLNEVQHRLVGDMAFTILDGNDVGRRLTQQDEEW